VEGLQNRQHPRFAELGALLAVSNLVIATTTSLPAFFLGLLALEIAFNLLSARLQARVSDMAPTFAGQWLVATMLLGAAVGGAWCRTRDGCRRRLHALCDGVGSSPDWPARRAQSASAGLFRQAR